MARSIIINHMVLPGAGSNPAFFCRLLYFIRRIPNEKELDRKTFPRLLAMSEVLWTYRKEKFEEC